MEWYVEIKKKLQGFSLDIKLEGSKQIIGLLGASGSGKSMTLRCIAGLINPDEGKIVVNGNTFFDSRKNINIKPQNRRVGFLFQNYALFPHLSIKENIAFGIIGLSDSKRNQKVVNLLEKFYLTGLERRYPNQISGGQQQRVALARTIAADPEIVLLDEPFSALDEHLRSHMMKEMIFFLKEFNKNTIFVTHNMEEAYRICDYLAIMSHGTIHTFGNKGEVFENPKTSEAAKITGCKNIVPARSIAQGVIEVPSWNIKLKVDSAIELKGGYCGIRANHIELACDDTHINVFKVKVVENIETPFRQTVYLKFENSGNDSYDYHIQWEVSKEVWEKISKNIKGLSIHLPQDKIMLFEK